MRTLLLMRHAKSDYPPGVIDRERPLAERGKRDAQTAALWLGDNYPDLDVVIVSPARRAQQTWATVAPCVRAAQVLQDARVYDDWGAHLADIVTALPTDARTALIVGHNPGIEELADRLARSGDAAAREAMARKYPTSAIAAVGFAHGWADVAETQILSFTVPRG